MAAPTGVRYEGLRTNGGAVVMRYDGRGAAELEERHPEWVDPEEPMGWGEAGPGAEKLALVLCLEVTSPEAARLICRAVSRRLVEQWDGDTWSLTLEQLQAVCWEMASARQLLEREDEQGDPVAGEDAPEGGW